MMPPTSEEPDRPIPRSFCCPLTMEVMVEPVIDAEGNTFEKKALLECLSRHRVSPVSRQPLSSNMVVPNYALRDTIHEFMGSSWVAKRKEELEIQYFEMEKLTCSRHSSKYRSKMECYLRKLSRDVGGGMLLDLDDNGVCMFNCEEMTIIIEVPEDVGLFFVYTIMHAPSLSEETKDILLELNRLPSETRGGTLSVKRYENGSYDIFFSYSDRVDEISATDFCNIVPNFIETAARLKGKFYGTPQEQRQVPSTPVSQETLCLGGMLAKTL